MPGPAGAAMLMAAKPGAILEGVRIAAKVFLLTIMFVFIIGALLVCFQVIIISSYTQILCSLIKVSKQLLVEQTQWCPM
jgi:hypothetical protein